MAAEWFYLVLDEEFGPVSSAELKALAADGDVASDTLVRKGPEGKWVLAGKVRGLCVPTVRLSSERKPPQPRRIPGGAPARSETNSRVPRVPKEGRAAALPRATRHVVAVVACAVIVFVYAMIGAALGWKYGGGAIPILCLLAILSGTWRAITGSNRTASRARQPKIGDKATGENTVRASTRWESHGAQSTGHIDRPWKPIVVGTVTLTAAIGGILILRACFQGSARREEPGQRKVDPFVHHSAPEPRGISAAPSGRTERVRSGLVPSVVINQPDTAWVEARAYYTPGLRLARTGRVDADFERALSNFTKAIERDPKYAEAYVARGCVRLYKFNQHALAVADHSKAIELRPDYADAYFHRADTYWDNGQNEEALEDCNKALRLAPSLARAYELRSRVLYALGKQGRATDDSERARQLGFNSDGPWYPWEEIELPSDTAIGDKEAVAAWQTISVPGVCTFRIPPTMEVQGGLYGEIAREGRTGLPGLEKPIQRVVVQPRGLNKFDEKALGSYARVIIETLDNTGPNALSPEDLRSVAEADLSLKQAPGDG